jgi:hypothetical protein
MIVTKKILQAPDSNFRPEYHSIELKTRTPKQRPLVFANDRPVFTYHLLSQLVHALTNLGVGIQLHKCLLLTNGFGDV